MCRDTSVERGADAGAIRGWTKRLEGLQLSSFAEHVTSIRAMWGQCSNTRAVDRGRGYQHMFGCQLQHQQIVTRKDKAMVVLNVLGVV